MPSKPKKSKAEQTYQSKQHLGYMWVLVLVLAALAIVGWSLYFVRAAAYQSEIQKLQQSRDAAVSRLQQYEDTNVDDFFNDYQ